MALPACACCGRTNPRRMIGLMTLWFGPFAGIRADHGYFHLCPGCYRDRIEPHLEQVQGRLQELHPLARQLGLRVDLSEAHSEDEAVLADDVDASPDRTRVVAASAGAMVEERVSTGRRSRRP